MAGKSPTSRTLHFVLPGTVRIKKNSRRIFKRGKRTINIPSVAYEEWETSVRWMIVEQIKNYWSDFKLLTGPIHVKAIHYYKGQQPDLSGMIESVGDAFEGMLWKNDKQIQSWDGSRQIHDKDNPRLCLWVEEFGCSDLMSEESEIMLDQMSNNYKQSKK